MPENDHLQLPFGPVWNSGFFSDYWLERRLPLKLDWFDRLSAAKSSAQRDCTLWKGQSNRVERYRKEAPIEEKLIQPVLEELGWKFFCQVSILGWEPGNALFSSDGDCDRALAAGHRFPDFWNAVRLVADTKAWLVPLLRSLESTLALNSRTLRREEASA